MNGTSIYNTNKTVVIAVDGYTAAQNITVNAVVTHIIIQNMPAKIEYYDGELLDLSGLAVTLVKSDDTVDHVLLADFAAQGITTEPVNGARLSTSNTSVVIKAGGQTAALAVTVHPVKVDNVRGNKSGLYYNYYFDVYGDYNEIRITESVGVDKGKCTKAEFEAQGYIETSKLTNTSIRIYIDGVQKYSGTPPAL